MKKSFIERIFPHPPGSTSALPQYEYESSVSSLRSAASPPRILLQESSITASSSSESRRNPDRSSSPFQRNLGASLVRHDDPFLPVERAAKNLERMFQQLLDAQSEGLSAGGMSVEEADDISSVGSPTPTPSIATTPLRSSPGPRTIPIRQPKPKKITLRGARRGLEKSMREFAALKQQELSLIDREVEARNTALKQASDLDGRKQSLEEEIRKIKSEEGPVGLRSEAQIVEREIQQLEAALSELKSKHRILLRQLREVESSKDSEISSYTESLALNEKQVKSFLRRPPVQQSLNANQDSGMYALKPERRTLHMAQEQWTTEVETLSQQKANAETEKIALEDGSRLWRIVVQRIRDFEKELRIRIRGLVTQSQSALPKMNGDSAKSTISDDMSMPGMLSKLSALISSLEKDLQDAEAKNWNLLVCAIGAEVAAFEQARELLQEAAGMQSTTPGSFDEPISEFPNDDGSRDNAQDEAPSPDLLNGQLEDMLQSNGARSPSESSNHSLEDTLREFANPMDKGKQNVEDEPVRTFEQSSKLAAKPAQPHASSQQDFDHENLDYVPRQSANVRSQPLERPTTSGSEDDEPGPEFLLSHS